MDAALRNELARAEDRHWWFEGRRRILAAVIESLDLPPGAALLEIGCGNGSNLGMLARFGATFGCEPDGADLVRASGRGIGRVEFGRLPGPLPFEGQPFDLVLLADVLEHIENDLEALVALRPRLAPSGRLVITVPAHPWLWSRHDIRNAHARRYRRSALLAVLARAGFEVTHVSYFNAFLLPLVAAVRILGGPLGLDAAGTGVPPGWINRALTRILGGEAKRVSARGLPAGVSLLAVARVGTVGEGGTKARVGTVEGPGTEAGVGSVAEGGTEAGVGSVAEGGTVAGVGSVAEGGTVAGASRMADGLPSRR